MLHSAIEGTYTNAVLFNRGGLYWSGSTASIKTIQTILVHKAALGQLTPPSRRCVCVSSYSLLPLPTSKTSGMFFPCVISGERTVNNPIINTMACYYDSSITRDHKGHCLKGNYFNSSII